MKILIADFETFFSDDYTLKKLSTEAYIRDPRFEAHGCAFYSPGSEAFWVSQPDLQRFLRSEVDWNDTFCISHHAHFDHLILSHHYGAWPRISGCTLSMARMLLGNHISVSLDSVRARFGLPPKVTPYHLFKGRHWHELDPATQRLIAEGACDEVRSIYTLFERFMREGFPQEELEVIDITIKMFSQPVLRADVDLLADLWESEEKRKTRMLADLDVGEDDLQSAGRFAALLEAEGIEIEYKDGKNGPIPAFAKNDEFMQALLEDEDDRVRLLAEARLGIKSTILQTRAETLGYMAARGPLPVYLRPYGAGTLRFSGGDGTNFQNFNRKDPESAKQASPLRRAIQAPDGWLFAPIDLSQIERRCLAYIAGQTVFLDKLRKGMDPYIGTASVAYGYEVTREMKLERGTGKQLELSCGYGAAEATIQRTARLGIYGPPVRIDLDTAVRWKNAFRQTNPEIVQYWKDANRMIARLAGGPPINWGVLHIREHKIYLPNGTRMNYDTLEYHKPTDEEILSGRLKSWEHDGYWRMMTRQGWKTMHGAKLTQNICEAISRVIVTQAAIRIHRQGYRILNIPHDELLVLVPDDGHAQEHAEACRQEMIRVPGWLPGFPLAAECDHVGQRYEK